MANYRVHTLAGAVLGGIAAVVLALKGVINVPQGAVTVFLSMVGAMLPDLDSATSRPRRILLGVVGVAVPVLLCSRTQQRYSPESLLCLMLLLYLFIQYPVAWIFGALTRHRGNFHSIPTALIAGETVWLLFFRTAPTARLIFALAIIVGALSHLLLDEIYSGAGAAGRLDFNYRQGRVLRLTGTSWFYTGLLYAVAAILAALGMTGAAALL